MKRHASHGPRILAIVLALLAIGLLQAAAPTPASAQDGVEPPDGVSGPAAAVSEKAPGQPEYVPDQLLVRFRANVPPGQAAKAMADEGTVPLKYQWEFNGAKLKGASGDALILTDVQPAQAGSYRVVVTNSAGAATSAVAVLTVARPPLLLNVRTTGNRVFVIVSCQFRLNTYMPLAPDVLISFFH